LTLEQSNHVKRKAVFLDRDGVINRALVSGGKPHPPAGIKEIELLPDVESALHQLKEAGYMLIVITNQPDVARGSMKRETVEEIHVWLSGGLPLDEIRTCYHDDSDECPCRKPKPGAILDAARNYGIDLSKSYMIGDRWRDIAAGDAAGCRSIFIDYGYDEKQPNTSVPRVESLFQAAHLILLNENE
jgi:D-glycero-D-manno-heptose 1,7-bisphosphate phosphatase